MLGTQKGHTDLESLVLFIFAFSIPVHAGMSVGVELRVSGPRSPESAFPVELCRNISYIIPLPWWVVVRCNLHF